MDDPRTAIPAVSTILRLLDDRTTIRPAILARIVRAEIAQLRVDLTAMSVDHAPSGALAPTVAREDAGEDARLTADDLDRHVIDRVTTRCARLSSPATAAINATGVVLHTGLGRAPLSDSARAAVAAAIGAWPVEYDPVHGDRGHRDDILAELVCLITDAPDATFANNGAGALMLALRAVAAGQQVAVSRGELIEIGGSFRLPDVIAAAGVTLHEVGTTNRTHLGDIQRAIVDGVAAVLVVHPSNYLVEGFTARPTLARIADACHGAGIPLVHDIGSGLASRPEQSRGSTDLARNLADEPDIERSLADGADLVTASGDKLLGGPQAGLVVGHAELIARVRRDPLARALRLDKLRVAALRATLQDHLAAAGKVDQPVENMLSRDLTILRIRAQAMAVAVSDDIPVAVVDSIAVVGGGAVPGRSLASVALSLPVSFASRLRSGHPVVATRVSDGHCLVDLTTVPDEDDAALANAIRAAASRSGDIEAVRSQHRRVE